MRVMILLGGFFPAKNHGGPVISIENVCKLLSSEIEFFIVTRDHDLGSKDRFKNISDTWMETKDYTILYLPDRDFIESKMKSIINDIKPDLIYINSLFSYQTVIPVLKAKENIATLIAPRGQLCKNAFRKKFKKFIYLFLFRKLLKGESVYYQFTSQEEKLSISKYLGIREEKMVFLNNISISPKKGEMVYLKKIPGDIRLVFVSRIHPKKNLDYALNLMRNLKGNINLDIYGPIEDEVYWNKCKSIISTFSNNINCEYKGVITHEKVYDAFSENHLFLFPTKSENFGHVIPEALMQGCLVVTSNQTPWQGHSNQKYLHSISLDNQCDFVSVINMIINMGQDEFKEISDRAKVYANTVLDQKEIKEQYLKVFSNIEQKRGVN